MKRKAMGIIAIVMLVVSAVAVGSVAFYPFTGFERGGLGSMSTTPSPYISNIEIDRYLYEDEGLNMRLKISGEVDLRERVNINGVNGWWTGRITVALPEGSQGQLFRPENHTNFVAKFNRIHGTMTVDVWLPWEWYEEHCLEGAYNVTVWLIGPYGNRTVLHEKIFNLTM